MRSLKTVAGSEINITTTDGVKVNGTSTVAKAAIATSNGAIHVVDTVLIPLR